MGQERVFSKVEKNSIYLRHIYAYIFDGLWLDYTYVVADALE